MMNDHFISIFIISCILLGIQSSVSAQSSDWVYSPYAQYLTNDTTIPPPVGESADAALSCFRHDTIYVLVMPTGQLYIWLRPDPLLDKYINLSPYAYCNGNPLKYIDPEGETWRMTGTDDCPTGFEWVDNELSYDSNGQLLDGLYEQAIFFSDNKSFNPNSNFNIGSSTAFVYMQDGSVMMFDACTLPSDLNAYPTIPQGMYDAVMGMHNGKYLALKMADVGNAKSEGGRIKLGYVNPAYDDNRTYISGGDIHYAGKDNFTGIGRNGQPVSSACLLIDRNMWDVFIQLFSPSNVVGVAVSRSFKNPISVISPK